MEGLIQITGVTNGYHFRRMKANGEIFQAKKSQGGMFYNIYIKNSQGKDVFFRHLASVVEELSEEVKNADHC